MPRDNSAERPELPEAAGPREGPRLAAQEENEVWGGGPDQDGPDPNHALPSQLQAPALSQEMSVRTACPRAGLLKRTK